MLIRPDRLLRLEAALLLLASLFAYSALHGRWMLFAALFLVPDLSLLGYLARKHKSFAAGLYNAVHNYAGPLVLGFFAWKGHSLMLGQGFLIWVAHIAVDRFLGFGLKYPQAFRTTHIQTVRVFHSS